MSLEIAVTLICDGCGTRASAECYALGHAKRTVWDTLRLASDRGWRWIDRGRYHTRTHYCERCLDRPMRPVPRRQRKDPAIVSEGRQ